MTKETQLAGKDFISLSEFTSREVLSLVEDAISAKNSPPPASLSGKSLAAIFFNPSLRTRFSFQEAMARLGGRVHAVDAGKGLWAIEFERGAVMEGAAGEHVKEAARVLERYSDAIAIRAFPAFRSWSEDRRDIVIRSFAQYANTPVINMESSLFHPCQGLADAVTIKEKLEETKGRPLCLTWAWHPKPLPLSVTHSALLASAHLGMEIRLACPPSYEPASDVLEKVQTLAEQNGGGLNVIYDQKEAARRASVLYGTSWTSIKRWNRPAEEVEYRSKLRSWKVTESLMEKTEAAFFMHCLPVRRNVVVTDGVLDGAGCAVYDQAENRIWAQMAILSALLKS